MNRRVRMWAMLIFVLTVLAQLTNSQETASKLGCMIYDENDFVYDVSLSKAPVETICKDAEVMKTIVNETATKVQQATDTIRHLRTMLVKLQSRNEQMRQLLTTSRLQLQQVQAVLTAEKQVAHECPHMYTLHSDQYKSCYMFIGRYLNWYDAETFCMSTGGHLVSMETEEEQNYLLDHIRTKQVLPGKHLWTGGNDIGKENKWMWAGINEPFNYTRWLLYPHSEHGPIQMPDDHLTIEHCVHLFHLHNYDWNDLYCGNLHYFVCEHKLI